MTSRKKKAPEKVTVTETVTSPEATPAAPLSRYQQRKAGLIKRDRRERFNR